MRLELSLSSVFRVTLEQLIVALGLPGGGSVPALPIHQAARFVLFSRVLLKNEQEEPEVPFSSCITS